MKIKVEFPTLSNQPTGTKVTGDVRSHGLSAISIEMTPMLSSVITVSEILETKEESSQSQNINIQLEYIEKYDANKTFGSFMSNAEEYAKNIAARIKAV